MQTTETKRTLDLKYTLDMYEGGREGGREGGLQQVREGGRYCREKGREEETNGLMEREARHTRMSSAVKITRRCLCCILSILVGHGCGFERARLGWGSVINSCIPMRT